ncbi:MAG: hypothetical protein IT383_04080 [Deltaproteobacteria bacterium]|nr:hypothetical protein [Deltaproteobacteria bacterium]
MIRSTTTRAALALAVLCGAPLAGCSVQNGSVFIQGILPIDKTASCVVDAADEVFVSGALLDVGVGDDAANALVVAARVVTNLPNTFQAQDDQRSEQSSPNYPNYGNSDSNVINFTEARVLFTTDDDRDEGPQLRGVVKTTGEAPSATGVGGTVYNTQAQLNSAAAIIATVITESDSAKLQGWVGSQGGQARVLTHIQLAGTTTGGGSVLTPPFVFPVDLCTGCLVEDLTTCTNGFTDDGCVRGVNERSYCN